MCYQCTSDPNPSLHALIPTLPYHPKCGSARLPEDYLTKCDNVTQMKDVVTIYDFVGIHERNNLLSDTKRKEMECGKFSFTKNSVIRRGCSFTSPARAWITYKDIVYQGKDKISANFCWSPRCNKGTTPWLGGAVLLLSLGASLARFANWVVIFAWYFCLGW